MNFLVLKKQTALLILAAGLTAASFFVWYFLKAGDTVVFNQQKDGSAREIHMVTGEYKTTGKNGKVIESYRWDPGTIFMEKGEKVTLKILGINGAKHPFYIEGTNIKGIVTKGEEAIVPLDFEKEGTYRLICHMHQDKEHSGPMIAYIIVD